MNINENIALAKSILRKQSISETDEDYLKIRELVGNSFGYVGILTRLRYVDNVKDFEELKSIFDVLKNSKLDIGKLNKMTYEQILDVFYDELTKNTTEDYELIFKDSEYSYFRVYTYKGILEIGSPAWCLKTKSNWDAYQNKYPEQWVAINNRYVKSIITPNNIYLGDKYVNNAKRWVRYGISIKHNTNEDTISWIAHDDNDGTCKLNPGNCTFFGVFYTVYNLTNGIKKSYYEKFGSCEFIAPGLFNMGRGDVWKVLGLQLPSEPADIHYLMLSKSYSCVPMILFLPKYNLPFLYPLMANANMLEILEVPFTTSIGKKIEEYIQNPTNTPFIGIRIKLGLVSIESVMKNPNYIDKYDNWLIFNWNENYYIIVNTKPKNVVLPTMDNFNNLCWISKENLSPMFFVMRKYDLTSNVTIPVKDEIANFLRGKKANIVSTDTNNREENSKKVKRFWDFLRKK